MHLGVFDVAHALVVADGQRQVGRDHGASIRDVAIEELDGVGDLHQLLRLVDLVYERIDAACEGIGRRYFNIGSGRRLGGKMRCGFDEVAESRFRFHVISDKHVLAIGD